MLWQSYSKLADDTDAASTPPNNTGQNMLETLKLLWRETIKHEGGYCPVCQRWGKIYKRNLNKTMAGSLIWLCKQETKDGWIDVPAKAPKWVVASNQLSTLKWWGLVERCIPEGDGRKKFSGLWRPTQKGIDFANNKITLPKAVYTYNDMVEDFSSEEIFIEQCFDEYFDYQDVMNNHYFAITTKGKK